MFSIGLDGFMTVVSRERSIPVFLSTLPLTNGQVASGSTYDTCLLSDRRRETPFASLRNRFTGKAPVLAETQSTQPDPGQSADAAGTIARLSSGDEQEWVRFCRTQGQLINAAGHKVGLSPDEREDLLQNTCVVCYHSIDRLRDPERLGAWVYRIAYRQALELVRKRPPTSPIENEDGRSILDLVPSGEDTGEAVLEAQEHSQAVARLIEELGDRCRRLLQALYLDSASPAYEEISQQLGMPIGSIGPTRARCLDRVRRRMKQVSGGALRPTNQQ